MSGGRFLGSAVAAREGAYFLQQSKNAVGNLIAHNRTSHPPLHPHPPSNQELGGAAADILPEVLRHSLPLSPSPSHDSSSFSAASKWALPSDPARSRRGGDGAFNPLRDYVSLPQVTFGPKRWELPESRHSVMASTANELRTDRYTHINPEKVKAAAAGLAQIGKAFIVATVMVFGGATYAFIFATSKLQIQNPDDIKVKARNVLQPELEMFKEQIAPLQDWAVNMSRKWHIEGDDKIKERPIVKELSKRLGGRSPS